MTISVFKQPTAIHSAENINYWAFQSTLRFAPRFNIRANFVDASTFALLNSFLLPTNPQSYSVVDAGTVLGDFISEDPNPFITTATVSTQARDYKVEVSESFEGLYVIGTSSVGTISQLSVLNNTSLFSIGTPSSIQDIGFVGGVISSAIDDIYIIGYATGAPEGYINQIELSLSPTSSIAVTASIGGGTPGYIIPTGISVFSVGATAATATKTAILANIDYFDWNEGNDFADYVTTSPAKQFLTGFKTQRIGVGEYSTLSFINGSASYYEVSTGATGPIPAGKRIDIPSGPANLGVTASNYSIVLKSSSGDAVSETINFVSGSGGFGRDCSATSATNLTGAVRLTWLNSTGGWDYFTFDFVENKTRQVTRETFNKNLTWQSTKQDRGFMSYKVDDHLEFTLNTNLASPEESEGIQSLFTTKEAYILYGSKLIPIEVLSSNYSYNSYEPAGIQINIRFSRGNTK